MPFLNILPYHLYLNINNHNYMLLSIGAMLVFPLLFYLLLSQLYGDMLLNCICSYLLFQISADALKLSVK
jgi:hypothetical protein